MTIGARGVRARRDNFALTVDAFAAGPEGTALVGGNGAGKSTLLLALQRLIPARGTIEVPERRAGVFAQPAVLRGSVQWNVAAVLASARPDISHPIDVALRTLDALGLAQAAGRDARELSSGERQRLALARALAIEPAALFLDEAFANVDADGRPALRELVRNYVQRTGCALVLATQTLADLTALCANVVLLQQGRDVAHLPVSALADADHPYLRALWSESRIGDGSRQNATPRGPHAL